MKVPGWPRCAAALRVEAAGATLVVAPSVCSARKKGDHKGRPYITMLDSFRLAEALHRKPL
jgi:hypothetical protein